MDAAATFSWGLKAVNKNGKLKLEWCYNAPFRAQQGQIHVFKGRFPDVIEKSPKHPWKYDDYNIDDDKKGFWDTGERWESDWCCAYVAQKSPNGPYEYFIKLKRTI